MGLTRMTTRSKNATTHPGTMAQDALRVRRKKEDVAKEKELKNAEKEARKEKRMADEARNAQGKVCIAKLKAQEAAAAMDMEKEIPRKRPVTQGWFSNCHHYHLDN
jgi:anthranilate/para-aminobenzoate synthase component I